MQHVETVENGATYLHQKGAMQERAQVLSIGNDCFGIPHVRYQLELKRGCNNPTIVQRTLALASFRARYRERMQALSTQEG